MKFTNQQACNLTLVAGSNVVYTATTDTQIRAFTVHNPTATNVDLSVSFGGIKYLQTTITSGATEIIPYFNNQQLKDAETIEIIGEGLNVLITVVQITG